MTSQLSSDELDGRHEQAHETSKSDVAPFRVVLEGEEELVGRIALAHHRQWEEHGEKSSDGEEDHHHVEPGEEAYAVHVDGHRDDHRSDRSNTVM